MDLNCNNLLKKICGNKPVSPDKTRKYFRMVKIQKVWKRE
jgi:hypothetical protein